MNKILTTPKEIEMNERVLYAGNHYISMPEISTGDASVRSMNLLTMSNKGLVEIRGDDALFRPEFYKDGSRLLIHSSSVVLENFYIPFYHFELDGGVWARVRIYADLSEKGFVYEFESPDEIEARLVCTMDELSVLRFNSHSEVFTKEIKLDKWLGNPAVNIKSGNISFSMAFGGDSDFEHQSTDGGNLVLKLKCSERNAIYVTVNSDMDGASTTLIHFRRKGYRRIYAELLEWLESKTVAYEKDVLLQRLLNENMFFNYFFAVGKDMESDRYAALTSRSPRYYVSGAFWERDSFLWSFPAIKLVDGEFYLKLCRDMMLLHAKNAGDHAHYIDGTVLYPGFELDEAASYFILLGSMEDIDDDILRAIDSVLMRIEREYDCETGLYSTFLMPSDDPSDYPFLTIDNVILWKGLQNLMRVYERRGLTEKAEQLSDRIKGIYQGIYSHLVKEIEGRRIFVWSGDGKGNFSLYNDPPGNLSIIEKQRKRLGTSRGFITAKPNCSIQSYVPAINALMDFKPSTISVCTYQAISGSGKTFADWPEMIDNVIPFISGEEEKSEQEPLKVWGTIEGNEIIKAKAPIITAQCIRVPAAEGHLAAVSISFTHKPSIETIIDRWKNYKGKPQLLKLPSAPKQFLTYFSEDNRPQTKLDRDIENGMGITLGRLREDSIFDYKFVCLSHNTLRGAAGGSVLTAELLAAEGYIVAK